MVLSTAVSADLISNDSKAQAAEVSRVVVHKPRSLEPRSLEDNVSPSGERCVTLSCDTGALDLSVFYVLHHSTELFTGCRCRCVVPDAVRGEAHGVRRLGHQRAPPAAGGGLHYHRGMLWSCMHWAT